MNNIELLDCTLRDGAYINGSNFGQQGIKGIIDKLESANIDIIECGWLKNDSYKEGSSYYHVPDDLKSYLVHKKEGVIYVAMIDWDRYDVDNLPVCDGKSLDAIRVVFPHGKHVEGIKVGEKIREKGYKVFFQLANTLAYSEQDLIEVAKQMNEFGPESISVVDTFGAMYEDDLDRILDTLVDSLDEKIKIGFHAHNNMQLAFSLAIHFANYMSKKNRKCIIDSTLSGMGRGAGNATTELIVSYLNKKCYGNYNLDMILDAIDVYMRPFSEKFSWGYSTEFFIAGIYQTHVNNIDYLLKNHRTNSKDMRDIISSLSVEQRRKYDYDNLEEKYIENQNRIVDDSETIIDLKKTLSGQKVLLLCPGKSLINEKSQIEDFIKKEKPITIAVNAIVEGYNYDYLFFVNKVRYEYANNAYTDVFSKTKKIITSNIKTDANDDEQIINFNKIIKRGWQYFDNAAICCLRFINRLNLKQVYIAGFDGFKPSYNESYADYYLPTLNVDDNWNNINSEIGQIFDDYIKSSNVEVSFITDSIFNK